MEREKRKRELRALKERQEWEEFERKVMERLETERKKREDFEQKRQQELTSLKERQEREEFERKELEKRLEKDRKEKEDLERKREQDLKSLRELREREEFERKVLEKLENERKEREDFERKTCEEREREEKTIEELKATLNEVQEREIKRAEERERIAREKRELEKRDQAECERMAKEEELLRERRLLEKLKRKKSEREEMERKAREEDLKREQILRKWLEMQEEEEKREAKEREEQQKRILKECGRKTQGRLSMEDKATEQKEGADAERKVTEERDRLQRDTLIKDQQEQERSKLEEKKILLMEKEEERHLRDKLSREEKDWDQRIEQLRLSREKGIQLESETREVARKLKSHLERRLELNQDDEIRQNMSEEMRVTKSRTQVISDKDIDPKNIVSKGKSKSQTQNMFFENPPGDIKKHGSISKDVLIRLNKLEKKNSRLNDEIQVPKELRLEAGKLSEQNLLTRPPRTKFSMKVQRNEGNSVSAEPKPKDVGDEVWSHRQRRTQEPRPSSSHEYFEPGSLKSRSERWARFMGSEEKSDAEDLPSQERHPGSSSSAENNTIPEPRYSLVGRYCPRKKTYAVEQQNVPPTPYGNPEQQEAYGSYVRGRVAEWRKMLGPRLYSADEDEFDERQRGGGIAGDVGLSYCTRTGKKRYPQIKQPETGRDQFGLKENRVQQIRVFRQLLTQARTSDYQPDILDAENRLLEKKLAEAKVNATNHYVQESILLVARRLISIFQRDEAYASSEDETDSQGDEVLAQIYLQEIQSKMKLPRPIFKTLMEVLLLYNEPIVPHFVEKICILDTELEVHLKKICNRVFARQGAKILRCNAEQLVDQMRHVQSCQLAELCRDSEEQTLRQWRRLSRNSLSGIRSLFHDYCDMHDALPRVTLQTIERLYGEWKDQRFSCRLEKMH
nr:trichohyalin [Drosophila suzukii]